MGHTTQGQIQSYTPDDTATMMYIRSGSGYSLQDLLELAQEKWPGEAVEDVQVESVYIHTNCLTYDLYDPADYTEYLVLSLRQ